MWPLTKKKKGNMWLPFRHVIIIPVPGYNCRTLEGAFALEVFCYAFRLFYCQVLYHPVNQPSFFSELYVNKMVQRMII